MLIHRYVCGMREVLKHVKSRRVKCLIVAPNMERIHSEGVVRRCGLSGRVECTVPPPQVVLTM